MADLKAAKEFADEEIAESETVPSAFARATAQYKKTAMSQERKGALNNRRLWFASFPSEHMSHLELRTTCEQEEFLYDFHTRTGTTSQSALQVLHGGLRFNRRSGGHHLFRGD